MKNMKRILTLGLALALSFSLAVPAFAADDKDGDGYDDVTGEYIGGQTITDSPDVEVGTEFTYKNEEGKTVPFIGIIKPTQIKATIPTQVVFDLDPTLNVVDDWTDVKADPSKTDINYAQVTNPSNLKIVNNSTIPMYVYVSDVKVAGDGFTAANLVNTNASDELDTAKNILFGITSTPEGVKDAIAGEDHWIKPNGPTDSTVMRSGTNKHYVLNPLKGTEPADPTKETKYVGVKPALADGTGGGELQLWVNAISITGWNSDDVFTVMPTIIVAAKDPDVTPVYTANTVNPGVNPGPNVGDNYAQDPVADVAPGLVLNTATVTLTSTDATKIFYTTDGTLPAYTYSDPTWTATGTTVEYSAAITIDATKTIKAIAATVGKKDSAVVTFAYTVTTQVAAPTIDYTTNISAVTITSTDAGATIYYTLDGTTPTTASTKYTAAFDLSGASDPVTISAFAVEADKIDSAVVSETYTPSGP